jgi:DNA polymerase III subunit epsilon
MSEVNIMNFVAIDFETATSKRSSVCSIGLAIVQGGLIVDTAYWLVKPKELRFDPFNTYIHGITEKDVINEPEFCELWPKIKPHLENKTVIAHNASFDISVLKSILDEYEIPYPTINYSCSCIISKKHWPDLACHKLDFISEYLGIEFKHHNALEDAMACAKIIIQVCNDRKSASFESLIKNLGMTMGGLFPGGYTPASGKKSRAG